MYTSKGHDALGRLSAISLQRRQRLYPFDLTITKTCLYNIDPLKSYLCKVKLGFRGVYITFTSSAKKDRRLWVLIRTASAYIFE